MNSSRIYLVIIGFLCCVIVALTAALGLALWPRTELPAMLVRVPTTPVAAQQAPGTKASPELIINLMSNGSVEINQETVALEQLQGKLTSIEMLHPDQMIVLRAGKDVPYNLVVRVLDTCRAAKLTNIAFATNRPDQKN